MNKYYKYHFAGDEVLVTSIFTSNIYKTLHRIDGCAIEIYENNCLKSGWHYVCGQFVGNSFDSMKILMQ